MRENEALEIVLELAEIGVDAWADIPDDDHCDVDKGKEAIEVVKRMYWQQIDLDESRDTLKQKIRGALKSCIHAHGPITTSETESTAKRIAGQINIDTLNKEDNQQET